MSGKKNSNQHDIKCLTINNLMIVSINKNEVDILKIASFKKTYKFYSTKIVLFSIIHEEE